MGWREIFSQRFFYNFWKATLTNLRFWVQRIEQGIQRVEQVGISDDAQIFCTKIYGPQKSQILWPPEKWNFLENYPPKSET